MTVRKWHVGVALESMASLLIILPELTEEEVLACLDLESQSDRRKSIIDRLIARAGRLHEIAYIEQLDKKYRTHL